MDMYLRILKAIDEEVVDRDVIRSQQVNFVNCFTVKPGQAFPSLTN